MPELTEPQLPIGKIVCIGDNPTPVAVKEYDRESGKIVTQHTSPGGFNILTKVYPSTIRLIAALLASFVLLIAARPASAQINGSPMPFVKPQFFTNNGQPAANYLICTYSAGTNNPIRTYTTSSLSVPNTNPLVLDTAGRAAIFWPNVAIKVALLTEKSTTTDCLTGSMVIVWIQDNIDASQGVTSLRGPNGASLVGYRYSPAATTRTVQSRLQDFVTVEDFAADKTGVTDATGPISTAISAVSANGGTVYVPSGTYRISSGTIAIPSNVCVTGSGSGTVFNGVGAFPTITILNATNACLQNVAVKSVNDGISIQSTSSFTLQPALTNINVLTIGDGFVGIHVSGTGCASGNCVFWPQFNNVNVNGGVGAPSVGTRIGYKFEGANNGTINPVISGGSVRNVEIGIYGANYNNLNISGTEFDGICNGSCNTTGSGIVFDLLGTQAQTAKIDARIETGETDILWNMTSGSFFNTINVNLEGGGGVAARGIDAGTLNCIFGTDGDVTDPTVVHDYCYRAQNPGSMLFQSGAVVKLPTPANGLLAVGGNGATNAQTGGGGLNATATFTANNSNWGYAAAFLADSSGRAAYFASQDFNGSTTGTSLIVNIPPGTAGIPALIPAGNGGAVGPAYISFGPDDASVTNTGIGLGGRTFAALGTPRNGVIIYCKDCKNVTDDSASPGAVCVNSGSGSLARRENGHWACN